MKHWQKGYEFYKLIKSFNKLASSKLNKNSSVNYRNPFHNLPVLEIPL